MKTIFYLSLLSGCAYFGWTFVNNPQTEKKTDAQETVQPSQKSAKSNAMPVDPVQMSSADKDSKYQIYVRKANKMDMENLSKRTEAMDKKTFEQVESVTNYKPQDIGNKRVNPKVETPAMTTTKYALNSSTNSTVQNDTATTNEKKKLSQAEEEMLKTNKGLSKANSQAQSDFQKNLNKLQETLNQK